MTHGSLLALRKLHQTASFQFALLVPVICVFQKEIMADVIFWRLTGPLRPRLPATVEEAPEVGALRAALRRLQPQSSGRLRAVPVL